MKKIKLTIAMLTMMVSQLHSQVEFKKYDVTESENESHIIKENLKLDLTINGNTFFTEVDGYILQQQIDKKGNVTQEKTYTISYEKNYVDRYIIGGYDDSTSCELEFTFWIKEDSEVWVSNYSEDTFTTLTGDISYQK
tara:strand:- start:1122 stop:1535 length:414 start_codon:yes stop_codon:yes gene_type:complete